MSCKCKECECNKSLKTYDKWKYTLLTTVIFIIVVSPKTYQLTNMLLSGIIGKTASKEGVSYCIRIIYSCYSIYNNFTIYNGCKNMILVQR